MGFPSTNQENHMPLARINLPHSTSSETLRAISAVIYDAMIGVAKVPEHDKFQIVTRHAADELIYPEDGFLGLRYTADIVFIQVTWNAGRSTDVKKAFYRAVADGIHARTGMRKEDVIINLVEVQRENWSFGNGDMQYAPA
jgi:4-oxalocrotonate tautomerase